MNTKQFATDLAYQAGEIIKTDFTLGMKKEWKENETPLTAADNKVNQLVVDAVNKNFPDYGLITEEGGSHHQNAEYVWICDPIDGTIPFSHGIPTCVFSIALVHEGEPILAVIYDPFMDRLFYAEKKQRRLFKRPANPCLCQQRIKTGACWIYCLARYQAKITIGFPGINKPRL